MKINFWSKVYSKSLLKGSPLSYTSFDLRFKEMCIYVPDHVGTLAQDGTSPNMGWPNKELTTLSLLRPKIP